MIDDDPIVRETLALLLASLGHSVLEAPHGRAGLETLENGAEVDLVLTDLVMPGISGWDVVKAVKEHWPSLRIGIVSGSYEALIEKREVVDVVITKPVSREILGAALAPFVPK